MSWFDYVVDNVCASAGDVYEFVEMCMRYGLDPVEVAETTGVFDVEDVLEVLEDGEK